MKLTKSDFELIKMADELVRANTDLYEDQTLPVACVVKAKSGKVYKGINIRTSHSICAEAVALGQALACGEREIDTVVAVKIDIDGSTRVVSPCGLCRYTYMQLGLQNMNIIVEDIETDQDLKVKAKDLLPYRYKRVDD